MNEQEYTAMVNAIKTYYNVVNDDRCATVTICEVVDSILAEKGYSEEEINDFNYF